MTTSPVAGLAHESAETPCKTYARTHGAKASDAVYFPKRPAGRRPANAPPPDPAAKARELCADCPLEAWASCYDYALTHAVEGVWAGTTEDERDAQRQALGIRPVSMTLEVSRWAVRSGAPVNAG